ncbi:MAG: thioredoxin [Oscillospiraceae bacterium]|jgi:thioredoxin 1|nr:thioredoxin [Oscillospiraceae bacterium]
MEHLNLTAETFDAAISRGKYLVDFWAEWCGPCKLLSPLLDTIYGENSDRFTLAKVDVDAEEALAERFGIMSIPTVILFIDGKAVKAAVGVNTPDTYLEMIDAA